MNVKWSAEVSQEDISAFKQSFPTLSKSNESWIKMEILVDRREAFLSGIGDLVAKAKGFHCQGEYSEFDEVHRYFRGKRVMSSVSQIGFMEIGNISVELEGQQSLMFRFKKTGEAVKVDLLP